MEEEKKKKKWVKMPRTFASQAYLREVERGVYQLYRDVVVEVLQKDGKYAREKTGKSICVSPFPLREFRDGDDERQVVLNSFHPTEARPLRLVEIRE